MLYENYSLHVFDSGSFLVLTTIILSYLVKFLVKVNKPLSKHSFSRFKILSMNHTNRTIAAFHLLNTTSLTGSILLGVLGLILNITMAVIIISKKHLHKSLNYLIANLALADLIYCLTRIYVSIQDSLASYYIPYFYQSLTLRDINILCKMSNFFISLSIYTSMSTLALISIERFRGIMNPLQLPFDRRTIKFLIFSAWIYSLSLSVLFIAYSSFERHEIIECSGALSNMPNLFNVIMITISAITGCILPSIIILICYTCIAIKLCSKSLPMDNSQYKKKVVKSIKKRNRTIVSLLFITIISSLSYCPTVIGLISLWYQKLRDPQYHWKLKQSTWAFYQFSSLMMLLSATINPILYNFVSTGFRKELVALFKCEKSFAVISPCRYEN